MKRTFSGASRDLTEKFELGGKETLFFVEIRELPPNTGQDVKINPGR